LTVTRGSNWLIDVYCRLRGRPRGGHDDAAYYFRRYGSATIVLGRFFTVVRVFVWPAAASHGVSYRRFVLLDVLGALLWASIWVLLGWFVGDQWEATARALGGWTAGIGVLIALALAIPFALRFRRQRARVS
jgi:membrane-associated protein